MGAKRIGGGLIVQYKFYGITPASYVIAMARTTPLTSLFSRSIIQASPSRKDSVAKSNSSLMFCEEIVLGNVTTTWIFAHNFTRKTLAIKLVLVSLHISVVEEIMAV